MATKVLESEETDGGSGFGDRRETSTSVVMFRGGFVFVGLNLSSSVNGLCTDTHKDMMWDHKDMWDQNDTDNNLWLIVDG